MHYHHLAILLAAIIMSSTGSLTVVQAVPIPTSLAGNVSSASRHHTALRLLRMMAPNVPVLSTSRESGPIEEQRLAPQLAEGKALVVPLAPYNHDWERLTFAPPRQVPLVSSSSPPSSALSLPKLKGLGMKNGGKGDEDNVRRQGDEAGPKAGMRAKHEHLSDDWEW